MSRVDSFKYCIDKQFVSTARVLTGSHLALFCGEVGSFHLLACFDLSLTASHSDSKMAKNCQPRKLGISYLQKIALKTFDRKKNTKLEFLYIVGSSLKS